jgi:hypothetical protein
MSMKYKIYSDRNLLVDVLKNNISLSDLEKLFLHEIENKNFKGVHKVISNIVDSKLDISFADLQNFINFMIKPDPDKSFRWAILTNEPGQAAFSLLIKEDKYFTNVVDVFSTLEACNKFLDISFDEKEFHDEDYTILD